MEALIWDYLKEIKATTLNVKGMMKTGKREEIENYMKQNNIKIMLLQETFINHTCMEQT